MREWWFNRINKFLPGIYKYGKIKDTYYWWQFYKALEEFNKNQKRTVAASLCKLFEAILLYLRPQNTKTGEFPHISFIESILEHLRTYLNNKCIEIMGLCFLEI